MWEIWQHVGMQWTKCWLSNCLRYKQVLGGDVLS